MEPDQLKEFDKLYKKYYKYIYNVCNKYSKGIQLDAEDMSQETWINIYNNFNKLDLNSPYLKTYLTRIAINATLMFLKKAGNRVHYSDKISFSEFDEETSTNTIIDTIENKYHICNDQENYDLSNHINTLLTKLSNIDKEIYNLYVNNNNSTNEIAEVLDIKRNIVYYSLRKTRILVKKAL